MKTKAYKLAAELGVGETSLLEWLRGHGYPNARRADTIRAEVCRAARRALGRNGRGDRGRRAPTSSSRRPFRPPAEQAPGDEGGLTVSFAELLEGHLPASASAGAAPNPRASTLPGMAAIGPDTPDPSPAAAASRALEALRAARDAALREADEWRIRCRHARSDLEAVRVEQAQREDAAEAIAALQAERTQRLLDLSTLRQRLAGVEDERATLEQTAAELQAELQETHEVLEAHRRETEEREGIVGALTSARQRESAWRTRALELERVAHLGESLTAALGHLGLEQPDEQVSALRAILATQRDALALLQAIRQVDAESLARLVEGRISRICADPICEQVAALDNQLALRANSDAGCTVCRGSRARRWFSRLVRECTRTGTRRLLIIGGDEPLHAELRELSQGQPVDLRLLPGGEAAHADREAGRVGACDLVVVLTGTVEATVATLYQQTAREQGRPVASVGGRANATNVARAACYRLARDLVLATV